MPSVGTQITTVSQESDHCQPLCIHIPINLVVPLKQNEVFGKIEGHVLPVTCDSGADIMIVPDECIGESQFTGETVLSILLTGQKQLAENAL